MLLSGFQHEPFKFGTQELSDRMLHEQVAIAAIVFFPLSVVVGHVSVRVASQPIPLLPQFLLSSILRADIWNALVRLLIADLFMEMLQKSLSCIPFEDYQDDIQELVVQSLGYGCPLYARPLSPKATIVVFGMRFIALALGVYLGEGWMPVAITGGIATGKSSASQQFVTGKELAPGTDETGNASDHVKDEKPEANQPLIEPSRESSYGGAIFLIDTDKIGHSILLESTAGNVHSKLVSTFGKGILDEEGVIDRKKLGALAFHDASLRRKLNKITHPRILIKMLQKITWGLFASGADITLVEIPLLFESGFLTRALFVLTICVVCTPEQQMDRLMTRNPELTKEECEARIASQMPLEEKAKMADIVINNNKDRLTLDEAVEEAREQILWRLYGVGLTLFQIISIMGISLPVAVYFKIYQSQNEFTEGGISN